MFTEKGESVFQKGLECIQLSNPNLREAMSYFEQAAEQGHLEALFQVGYWNMYGEPQIMRNAKGAFECFEICSERGISRAKQQLAFFYLWGMGIEKNEEKAVKLLEEAFSEGIYETASTLCHCFWQGVGVKRDISKARYYNGVAREMRLPGAEYDFIKLCSMTTDEWNKRYSSIGDKDGQEE